MYKNDIKYSALITFVLIIMIFLYDILFSIRNINQLIENNPNDLKF